MRMTCEHSRETLASSRHCVKSGKCAHAEIEFAALRDILLVSLRDVAKLVEPGVSLSGARIRVKCSCDKRRPCRYQQTLALVAASREMGYVRSPDGSHAEIGFTRRRDAPGRGLRQEGREGGDTQWAEAPSLGASVCPR